MGRGGNQLRRIGIVIKKVPDAIVEDAADQFIREAKVAGGSPFRFGSGKKAYPLVAERAKKKRTDRRASRLVVGTPAGAWAIKSYGRSESVVRRKRKRRGQRGVPRGDGTYSIQTTPGPTSGDGRWVKRVTDARRRIGDDASDIIERRL